MNLLITCKDGGEKILANEVTFYNGKLQSKGRGWIVAEGKISSDLCFANYILENPVKISAASVNSLAEKLADVFLAHIAEKRIDKPWAFLFSSSGENPLIHRANTVEKCWLEKIRKKISRVAKLSKRDIPHSSKFTEGFFVHFINFNQAFVSFQALSLGQQRMQMDAQAPSRSYLKIEEAFRIFGYEPQKNETVIDLGAAPGGWSYSALKRGAWVTAVDNGPLKGAVKSHLNMTHLKVDALSYEPDDPADWLLCDILEKPDIVLNLLHKWLNQKWCRRFIVNLKVGRIDPIFLLKKIKDPHKGLALLCKILHIRQLHHDREEITLMGQAQG